MKLMRVRCDFFGGDGQVTLIFAVFIVNYDYHFARAYGCNGVFDRGECPITVCGFLTI